MFASIGDPEGKLKKSHYYFSIFQAELRLPKPVVLGKQKLLGFTISMILNYISLL